MNDNPKITISLTEDEWFRVRMHLQNSCSQHKFMAEKTRKLISKYGECDALLNSERGDNELSEEAKALEKKLSELELEAYAKKGAREYRAKRRAENEASNS